MYLSAVLIRFFKSFNYDFLRKHHQSGKPDPWELIGDAWFPFVRIPLLKDITTVVGANESGKSHLLDAIKKGLTGEDITRTDFCRYSQFFTVEQGQMRSPDFGLQFSNLTEADLVALRAVAAVAEDENIQSFTLIQSNKNGLEVWVPENGTHTKRAVTEPPKLRATLLPKVFQIDSRIALPDSVSLSWLRGVTARRWPRKERTEFIANVDGMSSSFSSQDGIKNAAPSIFSRLSPFFSAPVKAPPDQSDPSFSLARDLLLKIARIDSAALDDLAEALGKENEGLVNGILQQINRRLAAALNFPKWWVQDRAFRLSVCARDDDLVFTISDRTQTEYSFRERSNGLRYFLSYYIQYLAHSDPAQGTEILLMDEPDAYLSSQGQQDLLKIFSSFARPGNDRRPIQVVYVTHSPFLVDRNHGERIRVLEKGTDDEGTRVVNDASKNHYEPLRSSFGAFVAETTFIGNCNLMVEGLADQVFLAGWSNYLRALNVSRMATLDLNTITIVPAGSASHIPYLVYLARGRDIEQPAVIVLLDGDKAGEEARKGILRGGPKHRQILDPKYICVISDLKQDMKLPSSVNLREMEDLVPPGIAMLAVRRYLETVCGITTDEVSRLTEANLRSKWTPENTLFDAIKSEVVTQFGDEIHIDKVGFARTVIEVVHGDSVSSQSPSATDLEVVRHNAERLLGKLASMQRKAERDTSQERLSRRLDRAISAFLRDHNASSSYEDAVLLFEEIDGLLDESMESDEVRRAIKRIRSDFALLEPTGSLVENYTSFSVALRGVKYAAVNAVQVAAQEQPKDAVLDANSEAAEVTVAPLSIAAE